jgi:hypothetical protein
MEPYEPPARTEPIFVIPEAIESAPVSGSPRTRGQKIWLGLRVAGWVIGIGSCALLLWIIVSDAIAFFVAEPGMLLVTVVWLCASALTFLICSAIGHPISIFGRVVISLFVPAVVVGLIVFFMLRTIARGVGNL